jgi:hypothetical protein
MREEVLLYGGRDREGRNMYVEQVFSIEKGGVLV